MQPLSFYLNTEYSQALMHAHGDYLERASDRQLFELNACTAAAIAHGKGLDMHSILLCRALSEYLYDRATRVQREPVAGSRELWTTN